MKKSSKLLFNILTIIGASANIIPALACSCNQTKDMSPGKGGVINRKDLATDLSDFKFVIVWNNDQTYNEIDPKQFKNNPDFVNMNLQAFTMTFFKDATATEEITDVMQEIGTVYVRFSATATDLNWMGTSKLYELTLTKRDLNTVKNISFQTAFEPEAHYKDLDLHVFEANPAFQKLNLYQFFVHYYATPEATANIDDNKQTFDSVYVKFTAKNDEHWTGTSNALGLTLTKKDLSTVEDFQFHKKAEPSQTYETIPLSWYATNPGFEALDLTKFTVKYFEDNAGNTEIQHQKQNAKTVYVQFRANNNDPIWTGTTPRFLLVMDKADLNTISSTIMFQAKVNQDETYNNIEQATYFGNEDFNNLNLKNYIVNYFQDKAATISLNDALQAIGTVFVQFTAYNDPNWSGTSPILQLRINKKNLSEASHHIVFASTIKPNNVFSKINHNIFNKAPEFAALKLVDYDLNYYRDYEGKKNINQKLQEVGEFFVRFTAKNDDPHWFGISPMWTFINRKADLRDLPKTLSFTTLVDPDQTYSAISYNVFMNNADFANLDFNKFTVRYYSNMQGTTEITNQNQADTQVYVMFIAEAADDNWTGQSFYFPLTLTKENLSNLENIRFSAK